MTWNGEERRVKPQPFCTQHIDTVKVLAELTTTIRSIEQKLTDSMTFRRGITISLIGVIVTMFMQLGAACYFFGQMNRQVSVNTERLAVIEEQIR